VADVLSAADLSECAERSFASHISLAAAAAAAAGGVTTATSGHLPGTARFARLGPSAERKFASRTRTGTERSVRRRRRRRMLLRVRPSSLARTSSFTFQASSLTAVDVVAPGRQCSYCCDCATCDNLTSHTSVCAEDSVE